MSYTVEKEWITKAGFKAVVIQGGSDNHRCGYVGLPEGHKLDGIEYMEKCDALKGESPEEAFHAHGGITFSSERLRKSGYPVEGPEWWFGFDCAHAGDTEETCTLEYCIQECEDLAAQIKELA